jgi:hypothetical protein
LSVLASRPPSLSSRGWAGLLLISICWPLNWALPGIRTSIFFFPLWIGFIYLVDGLVLLRRGDSLATRAGSQYYRLFLVSIPAWWLFELMNLRTRNWEYLGCDDIANIPYFIGSSVCFSTVIPAVFETAELVRTLPFFKQLESQPMRSASAGSQKLTRPFRIGAMALGAIMLALILIWPRAFYPLLWGGFFLIIDPINDALGRPSLIAQVRSGNRTPAICLSLGALICGFFWEMWNYYSWPKWIYHTPGAGFLHVFEMPVLGYIGYVPFSWELYALCHLLWRNAPELRVG